MRWVYSLAAATLLLGFGPGGAADVGSGPSEPVAEPASQDLYAIDSVTASCDSGVLTLTGGATASTPGWMRLRFVQTESSKDTLTFTAVGVPPSGIVAQVLEHVHLASQANANNGIAHVHITASSNALDVDVLPPC